MTDRCSLVSSDLDEPLAGTAVHAPAWLLLEDTGPWGRDAPRQCTIDDEVAAGLASRAEEAGVRIQLIRRPSRAVEVPGQRTAYLVHSGPSDPWIRRLVLDEEELATFDPRAATRQDPPPGLGEEVDGDLYLVCTHGKRDACCAQFGRPIAEAVARKAPEATWETSHTGGHRFAAVMIAMPDGLTFGRLTKRDATSIVRSLQAGKLPLPHFRGRSADTGPGQAAEVAVRREAGVATRGHVRVVDVAQDGGANVVQVDVDGTRWRAVVASRPLGTLRTVSCGGPPEDKVVHALIGVAPVGQPSTVRT